MRSPSPVLTDACAAILAGGRGKRLGGMRKALLRAGNETLAERSLSLLRPMFAECLFNANETEPYADLNVPIITDRLPGKGAPGGLHAVLAASQSEWLFLVACDMPFVRTALITDMARHREGVDAVICIRDDRPEPLHAFYRRSSCLPVLEQLLRTGDPSFRDLLAAVEVRELEPSEWMRLDPEGRSFQNVNTPEDLAAAGLERPGS